VPEKGFFSGTSAVLTSETGHARDRPNSHFVLSNSRGDDLDPIDPGPPTLPVHRPCSKPRCRRSARAGGRYCRPCSTEASARWYRANRAEILARRLGRRDERDEEQRARDSARAYVAVYARRGKLARARCVVCDDPNVQPSWRNPKLPLEVSWICREHARDQRETAASTARDVAALKVEYAELRDAIALLPRPVQRQLHEEAMRGLLVRKAGDLMYVWNLRRALQRLNSSSSSDVFFQ